MKVGIDGYSVSLPYHCGVKNYTTNLIKALSLIDKNNQYYIFSRKEIKIPNNQNFHRVNMLINRPFFIRELTLVLLAKILGIDLIHYPNHMGSTLKFKIKTVTTVHDIDIHKIYPKSFNIKSFIDYLQIIFTRFLTIRNSNELIVDSKTIKSELISLLKNYRIKRNINTIALSHNTFIGKNYNSKYKYHKKNYLCMSDFSPRKNTSAIIEAYSKLPSKILKDNQLVIISSTKKPLMKLNGIIKNLKIKKKVKFVIAPSNRKLLKFYKQSLSFLYPSLYEGFGIPILEAMNYGCPVITSNYGAMKEVARNAAYLVNPYSVDDITKAMQLIARNKKLREGLIEKGFKRAREYSWKKTARETLKVYEKVNNSR
jgi:glycosyltransferase involved in cell wall biosynthesis